MVLERRKPLLSKHQSQMRYVAVREEVLAYFQHLTTGSSLTQRIFRKPLHAFLIP